MNNIKCPNCGFINFVTAECCRKCETPFTDGAGSETPYNAQGAQYAAYPRPFPVSPQQGGGGGVPILKIFLCLFGGLVVISALAGGGVAFLTGRSTVSWREFRPPHGNYIVMMPKEPKTNQPVITPMASGSITNHIYTSAIMGQGSVLFCVVTFPVTLNVSAEKTSEMLEEELKNILAENKSTLISKKGFLVAGSQGLEFEFTPLSDSRSKKSRGFGKVFFKQNHEYLLMMTASEDSDLFLGKDKFLTPIVY